MTLGPRKSRAASSQLLSTWVVSTVCTAYRGIYCPLAVRVHSTRSQGSLAAFHKNVPLWRSVGLQCGFQMRPLLNTVLWIWRQKKTQKLARLLFIPCSNESLTPLLQVKVQESSKCGAAPEYKLKGSCLPVTREKWFCSPYLLQSGTGGCFFLSRSVLVCSSRKNLMTYEKLNITELNGVWMMAYSLKERGYRRTRY